MSATKSFTASKIKSTCPFQSFSFLLCAIICSLSCCIPNLRQLSRGSVPIALTWFHFLPVSFFLLAILCVNSLDALPSFARSCACRPNSSCNCSFQLVPGRSLFKLLCFHLFMHQNWLPHIVTRFLAAPKNQLPIMEKILIDIVSDALAFLSHHVVCLYFLLTPCASESTFPPTQRQDTPRGKPGRWLCFLLINKAILHSANGLRRCTETTVVEIQKARPRWRWRWLDGLERVWQHWRLEPHLLWLGVLHDPCS